MNQLIIFGYLFQGYFHTDVSLIWSGLEMDPPGNWKQIIVSSL